ncbi:hypothetical protein [Ascidiimonas aurantiaca]|uniref:hypothetical protein n=1 Tax=Ascidiimonas aurantiaca TaxID=1685432 RepID=UPI0030EF8577
MTPDNFKEIQKLWNQQETNPVAPVELMEKGRDAQKKIKNQHKYTMIIMAVTAGILISFFISIAAWHYEGFTAKLFLMVFVLLLRWLLEKYSFRRWHHIKPILSAEMYMKKITAFYRWRRKLHIVYTPILIMIYTIGFVLLLPYFEAGLSRGFYLYVVWSGVVSIAVICVIIFWQTRKELRLLRFLKKHYFSEV